MRIISLVPSVTETLYELGLEDQIVAVSRFCRLPARVKEKPRVGGTKNPKLDRILELKPDVVILNTEENRKQDAYFLREHAVPLLVFSPNTMEEAADMVDQLGKTFRAEQEAQSICSEIRNRMVTYLCPAKHRTLILIWRKPFMSINRSTYVHSVSTFFGFENVFASSTDRYPKLTGDEIRSANPEFVLFPDEPYPFREKHLQDFRNQFPEIAAVQKKNLLICDGTLLTWHGYGTLRALREFPAVLQERCITGTI